MRIMDFNQTENQVSGSINHEHEIGVWREISKKILRELLDLNVPVSSFYSLKQEFSEKNLSYHQKSWLKKGLEIAAISRPSARLYFGNTPLLLKHLKTTQLISWGDWTLQLLSPGKKTETISISFLEISPEVVEFMSHYELKKWFATGYHLSRQSIDLGSAYFRELPQKLSDLYMTERLAIYQLITGLTEDFPKEGLHFYWSAPNMLGQLNSIVRTQVLNILQSVAADQPENLIQFFNAFIKIFETLEYPAQESILKSEKKLRGYSLEASMVFLLKARELLQKIPYFFVPHFVTRGLSIISQSESAGIRYFDLETDESRQEIIRWKQAILLDDHRDVLNYFACALTGREIGIKRPEDDPDWKNHSAGVYPTGDGRNIYLPDYAAGGNNPQENFKFYKAAVAHQAGYMEWGIFQDSSFLEQADFDSFVLKALAMDIFFVLEDGRIDHLLREEYRGLSQDLERVLAIQIADRLDPINLPLQEAMIEILLRMTCGLFSEKNIHSHLKRHVHFLKQELTGFYESRPGLWEVHGKTQKIYDYVSRLPQSEIYHPLIPLAVHGRVEPELLSGRGPWPTMPYRISGECLEEETEFQKSKQEKNHFLETNLIPDLRFIEEGDEFPTQGLFLKNTPDMGAKPGKDKPEQSEFHGEKDHFHFPGTKDKGSSGPFYYDEWDYQTRTYRRRWCRLYERDVRLKVSDVVRGVYRNNQDLIHKVRRQFQRIRPEWLNMVRGVDWGQEFYWPALIRSIVERKAGVSPTERVFARREKKQRKISILFLIDMSASTDEQVPCRDMETRQEKRIIDIEIESLVVMMEALDAFSDEYSIYGFSGDGRGQVDFYRVKNFADPYSEMLKQRIGGIEPQRSTRMGAAIRHAVQKMMMVDSDQRLLILLSDGFPQDSDYGEDRSSNEYGLQDTMMALIEARREGIRPFCITVDQAGNDYLKKMCDPNSYLVIQDVYGLPETMPKIVASLMLG